MRKQTEGRIKKRKITVVPFNIIKQSNILTTNDWNNLASLAPELQTTFIKSQVFRTRTEMEVSVLNDIKFPTHSSKYWQAMREQNVMFTELVMLSYEYRKNLIEIKIKKREMDKEKDNLKKELLKIEIEKKIFISKKQERVAKDRIRELKAWSEIKKREANYMSKDELEEVDNHQLISYTKRWIKQSILMGSNGSPAERQNLLGQLRSGILLCIRKGVLDSVLKGFDFNIQNKIRKEYKVK